MSKDTSKPNRTIEYISKEDRVSNVKYKPGKLLNHYIDHYNVVKNFGSNNKNISKKSVFTLGFRSVNETDFDTWHSGICTSQKEVDSWMGKELNVLLDDRNKVVEVEIIKDFNLYTISV